jgi:hypothetical protein
MPRFCKDNELQNQASHNDHHCRLDGSLASLGSDHVVSIQMVGAAGESPQAPSAVASQVPSEDADLDHDDDDEGQAPIRNASFTPRSSTRI